LTLLQHVQILVFKTGTKTIYTHCCTVNLQVGIADCYLGHSCAHKCLQRNICFASTSSFYFLLIYIYEDSHKANNYEVATQHFIVLEALSFMFKHQNSQYKKIKKLSYVIQTFGVFLTSALDGSDLSASIPAYFTSAKRGPGSHWTETARRSGRRTEGKTRASTTTAPKFTIYKIIFVRLYAAGSMYTGNYQLHSIE
jgi:hypothetical protein